MYLAPSGHRCGKAGSFVAATGLGCSVAYGILVPGPGLEPTSPAFQGGFLTTGPHQESPCAAAFGVLCRLLLCSIDVDGTDQDGLPR